MIGPRWAVWERALVPAREREAVGQIRATPAARGVKKSRPDRGGWRGRCTSAYYLWPLVPPVVGPHKLYHCCQCRFCRAFLMRTFSHSPRRNLTISTVSSRPQLMFRTLASPCVSSQTSRLVRGPNGASQKYNSASFTSVIGMLE